MGKPDQSKAAYKKAIGINSENILAWQVQYIIFLDN